MVELAWELGAPNPTWGTQFCCSCFVLWEELGIPGHPALAAAVVLPSGGLEGAGTQLGLCQQEGMLRDLQKSVEEEEQVWKAKLTVSEEELQKVGVRGTPGLAADGQRLLEQGGWWLVADADPNCSCQP